MRKVRCVLVWADMGAYHVARSLAVSQLPDLDVVTLETLGVAKYDAFRAPPSSFEDIPTLRLGLPSPPPVREGRARIREALEQLAPDVVFVPGWQAFESLVSIEWCLEREIRVVLMSESTQDDHRRTPWKEAIKRRVIALASCAFVGGSRHVDYVVTLGIPRDRVFCGYDVVDNKYFATETAKVRANACALRRQHNLPERYFFSCARLIEIKNISRLIEAFAKYQTRAGEAAWSLIVVGPGPQEAKLRALASALGLEDRVRLVGAAGYADLPIFYGLANAFVLASTKEPWGLVVNEAMASGLPILASSRCGCSVELIEDGRNGYVFEPDDVEAITDAMTRITADDCDRASMGHASQDIIQHWGPNRFASGFEMAAKGALLVPKRTPSWVDRWLLKALMQK